MGEKLEQLKKQYDEKLAMKEELRRSSEDMEVKLDRADKLVSGLAGERARWETTVIVRMRGPFGHASFLASVRSIIPFFTLLYSLSHSLTHLTSLSFHHTHFQRV